MVSGTERGAASAYAEVTGPAQSTAQERAAYESMEESVWDLRQRWSIDIVLAEPNIELRVRQAQAAAVFALLPSPSSGIASPTSTAPFGIESRRSGAH
jgi:hypothetical protein